jgi:hypothetical protein
MSVTLVQDIELPEGVEPLCWLVLTTLLVEDLAGASLGGSRTPDAG